jgi:hypothetical protein
MRAVENGEKELWTETNRTSARKKVGLTQLGHEEYRV